MLTPRIPCNHLTSYHDQRSVRNVFIIISSVILVLYHDGHFTDSTMKVLMLIGGTGSNSFLFRGNTWLCPRRRNQGDVRGNGDADPRAC